MTRELERIAHPADPTGVLERLDRRRETQRRRHELLRPVKVGAIASIAVAGTVASFLALSGLFRDGPPAGPTGPGGTIVFGRFQLRLDPDGASSGSRFEIWSMAPDGSDLRLVYAPEAGAMTPTWSPNGERIAFLEPGPPGGLTRELRLITSRPDGSDRQVVAEGLATPVVHVVAWSPDASQIAVLDTQEKGLAALDDFGLPVTDIAIYSIDGTFERFVDVPGIAAGFAWTPDGSGFIVADISNPRHDLLHVDANGRVLGTIAADVSYRASPAFSPDRSRIAFIRTNVSAANPEEGEVWVANADGTGAVRITREGGRKPSLAWSVEGTRILYSRQTPERCDIVSVGADGSDRIVVADRSSMGGCAQELSVQPGVLDASASPEPIPSSTPEPEGRDMGLGFTLCNLEWLDGIDFLGDDTQGQAWTGARVKANGACPERSLGETYLVAVDIDGDGAADAASETVEHCFFCRPFDVVDLDVDGAEELVVLASEGTTPTFMIYGIDAVGGELAVAPLPVAEPGHPEAGLEPGSPLKFSTGGDEGFAGWVGCDGRAGELIIEIRWRDHPIEGEIQEIHETGLALRNGNFHVVSANDYSAPTGTPVVGASNEPACGVDWQI